MSVTTQFKSWLESWAKAGSKNNAEVWIENWVKEKSQDITK